MKKDKPDIIVNEFIRRCDEWVALHDEDIHFKDNTRPQIKIDGNCKKIRANQKFKTLPLNVQEALVCHELGHLALHYGPNQEISNPFYRIGQVINDKVSTKEIEADLYACEKFGFQKYIDALKQTLILWKHSFLSSQELNLRIQYLSRVIN